MKPEKIKALLPLIGSEHTGSRQGWILGRCPMLWRHDGFDQNPSFAVSHDPKKKSRVKCLSCGYSGDLTDVMLDLKFGLKKNPQFSHKYNLAVAAAMITSEFEEMELTAEDIPDFEEKPPKTEYLFPEQWLKSFKKASDFPDALAYMKKRGLPESLVVDLDLRYDPIQRRLCFPYRNFKGELMGLQGRIIEEGHELPYYQYGYMGKRNAHIWMGEHRVNMDEPIVLCEGPMDYGRIFQVYENVAASFTSGLSRTKVKRIGDADTIITFYDFGKGGDAARESIRKYLPNNYIVDIIPTKAEDDPGSMKLETIANYLSEHVSVG